MARQMFSFKFDDKQFKKGFYAYSPKGLMADSARSTLNVMASLTRRNAIRQVNKNFINRNTFTKRNIQFRQAKAKNINQMFSRVGATQKAGYMELQELGGLRKPKRGNKLAIPQTAARGGSKSRLVQKESYLRRIKNNRVKGKMTKRFRSAKARTVARAYVAHSKNKFMKYRNNMYKINTFAKNRNSIRFTKQHLYNMTENRARVKSNAWLMPSTLHPIRDAQSIFNSQARKNMRKLGIKV